MNLLRLLYIVCLVVVSNAALSQGAEKYIPAAPNPPRLVNDLIDVLTPAQEEALERKLVAWDDSSSSQLTVVTIGDIGNTDINEFAAELGRKWGVGGSQFNNGIVLVILIDKERNRRQVAIATGYGLEGAIPDYTAKEIIETQIIPNFKANDIYRGLEEGTDALIKAAGGTYKAPDNYRKGKEGGGNILVAIIVFIVIMIIISNINRRGGGGMMSRRGYRRWDNSPPVWWFPSGGSGGGGWGGGSSSSGGGFGGFGGGSFGGGGASGSW